MTNTDESDFYTVEDLPPINDPQIATAASKRIMARHMLATLRQSSGMTLLEVAEARGVTKAAVHQLENRPLTKVSIGSLVDYFQALGYAVDEDWVARTITNALPAPVKVDL